MFRRGSDGRLDCLIANGPSPNGIAVSPDDRFLYVAMTRSNAVWRGPMQLDGSITKVGAFRTFFGTSGPDGLTIARTGELVVAHASLGCAIVCKPNGEVSHLIVVPGGRTVTNVAFRPGSREVVLTESHSGTVFAADVPFEGLTTYSHTT